MHAKSHFKSCPTLCTSMDCRPLGFSAHGISQARIPKWVAISLSRGSSQPRDWTHVSCLLHWLAGSLPLAPPGKPATSPQDTELQGSLLWETRSFHSSPTSKPNYHEAFLGPPAWTHFPWLFTAPPQVWKLHRLLLTTARLHHDVWPSLPQPSHPCSFWSHHRTQSPGSPSQGLGGS